MTKDPKSRALLSLSGLSVGDALGEQFFGDSFGALQAIRDRKLPRGPCRYTDDTQMALSIVDCLLTHGHVDPDLLAAQFAARYEYNRGYGGGARRLMQAIRNGGHWADLSPAMFGGSGSYGNGASMRVAPLGAYFADDLDSLVRNAVDSARVTHSHPEGIAGAVAVAVAAALAWTNRGNQIDGRDYLEAIAQMTPAGQTRDGLLEAATFRAETPSVKVAQAVGSGRNVSAQDTVPFALWCAATHFGNFVETFWATVAGLGDRDTTCAIACGVVVLSSGPPPDDWLALREPLELEL